MKSHLATQTVINLLKEHKSVWVQAQGFSNWPTIKPGEWLCLRPILNTPPQTGDFIVFIRHDHLVVHRFIRFDAKGLVKSRGDASRRWDPALNLAQIVAVVDRKRHKNEGKEVFLHQGKYQDMRVLMCKLVPVLQFLFWCIALFIRLLRKLKNTAIPSE